MVEQQKKKLLDRIREKIRLKHYSLRTEESYVGWAKQYIFFHDKKHPETLGSRDIESFLTHLAIDRNVAASTQNQAFNALLFLYREVLEISMEGEKINAMRAKKKQRVPMVLSKAETMKIIRHLDGVYQIIGKLLYGGGLRLLECLRLRVNNLDFEQNEIHLLAVRFSGENSFPRSQEWKETTASSARIQHRQRNSKGGKSNRD